MVHELTRQQARRIAVRAQLLDADRPTDLLALVRHLSLLQVDLTAYVAPNVDLVLWSRLGDAYRPEALDVLIEGGDLVEHRGVLRPMDDLALYRADMRAWPDIAPFKAWRAGNARWLEANRGCRDEILALLRSDGPLPAQDLPDTCAVPWRSSGWNNDRNVRMMLELLEVTGQVAVAGREGRERLWDLAERVHVGDEAVPSAEALRERDRRRLVSLGIARAKAADAPVEPLQVGEAGEPAVIEGVRGSWRVDPDQLDRSFRGRAALLSPLDRLIVDRKRMAELFEFDYQLEMYKPAAQRRFGYFALPILYGDRLVGKVDAASDLDAGALRVDAIHRDVEFTAAMTTAVEREIRSLARMLGLDPVLPA